MANVVAENDVDQIARERSAYALHGNSASVLCRCRHGPRNGPRCLNERDHAHVIIISVGLRAAPAPCGASESKVS
jgi:hypothetical protein